MDELTWNCDVEVETYLSTEGNEERVDRVVPRFNLDLSLKIRQNKIIGSRLTMDLQKHNFELYFSE